MNTKLLNLQYLFIQIFLLLFFIGSLCWAHVRTSAGQKTLFFSKTLIQDMAI